MALSKRTVRKIAKRMWADTLVALLNGAQHAATPNPSVGRDARMFTPEEEIAIQSELVRILNRWRPRVRRTIRRLRQEGAGAWTAYADEAL